MKMERGLSKAPLSYIIPDVRKDDSAGCPSARETVKSFGGFHHVCADCGATLYSVIVNKLFSIDA